MAVSTAVRTVSLPSGEAIPVLGQGTWHVGENPRRRAEEIAALRLGIELGMSLIDTAEMYANGHAEELVGEAIEGRRDEVFLVSKVLPQHATLRRTIEACERSLMRLGVDEIDLYLLHWRGAVPLGEEGVAQVIERVSVIRAQVDRVLQILLLSPFRTLITVSIFWSLASKTPLSFVAIQMRPSGILHKSTIRLFNKRLSRPNSNE